METEKTKEGLSNSEESLIQSDWEQNCFLNLTTIVKMFFTGDTLANKCPCIPQQTPAFNFLTMKRLQNEKLHVPFVEQQKAESCLNVCHSLIKLKPALSR